VVNLRIVAYNVRGLRDDRSAVVQTLRALDADVACIQEAPRFFRWRSRCAALARESGLLYVAGGGTAGGTAMLAAQRVDVSAAMAYRLSRTPRLHTRGAVAAQIHKAGARCTVVSVHLGLDAAERGRHLGEIRGLLNRYRPGVAIVAGDINETPDQPTWRALAGEYTDAGDQDLTLTFTSRVPRRRIDGVFVRGPAEIRSYRVIDDAAVRIASDHRPVVVDLEIPETSAH
jgi:endonuclease/exonuclease/phosphatase family metal-dependent hydrolase